MFSEGQLIDLLKKCSDYYYNTGDYYELTENECNEVIETLNIPCQLLITDAMFDEIYNKTKQLYPSNTFFMQTGISARSQEKVELPYVMGSMTELHEGELLKWINPLWQYCLSAKLDGCSCGLLYKNGKLYKAYTRGDGYKGQDITKTIMRFNDKLPKTIPYTDSDLFIRGEIIIPKAEIQTLLDELKEETGRTYKNGRNSVAGCLNAKIAPEAFVKHAHMLCYHIEGDFVRESAIFESLEQFGFETPVWKIIDGLYITEEDMIVSNKNMKVNYEYEVDGTILTEELRADKGFDTGTINPKCSKKFKVGCVNDYKESTVRNIIWQISKDGYAKPVINIDPIELDGAEVSFVTGNNYKNVIDNHISIGSVIKCHRAGQVIPFIDEVVKPAAIEDYNLPNTKFFTSNGTDLVFQESIDFEELNNDEYDIYEQYLHEIYLQKALYFCQKMEIEYAGEGNLRKMFTAGSLPGYTNNPYTYTLFMFSKEWYIHQLGVNGGKLYDSLCKMTQNMNKAKFFDAIGCFGRGIGEKKLQKLLDTYDNLNLTKSDILSVEGFAETTALQMTDSKHIAEYNLWTSIVESNQTYMSFAENVKPASDTLKDLVVAFTGIRDKEMEAYIINNGGKIASSVTKSVNLLITKDVNSTSDKIAKAKKNNVKVISYEQAKQQFK